MENEVLVLGGNHQNPLGVIESLGREGIRSNVIIYTDRKNSFVLKSKYVKRGWICHTEEEMLKCIRDNFNNLSEKAISIACNDDCAAFLSNHYSELAPILHLPVVKGDGAMSKWMSKDFQIKVAHEVGLETPREWIVSRGNIAADIVYPCVTKSLTSVGNGKSEFSLCRDKAELSAFLEKRAKNEKIQIQQFIDKEFEYQFMGLSLDDGDTIIIPGRTHIERTINFNNLVFLKYQAETDVAGNDILPMVKSFIKKSGYNGLFSAEFMHGKDGKEYFLEVNFRNDGNAVAITSAGTNLPYIWYQYCSGEDYQAKLEEYCVNETYLMPEDSYLISMLGGEMSFKEWLTSMKKTTCFLTYFKGDTAPFWALMWLQKRALTVAFAEMILRKMHIKFR